MTPEHSRKNDPDCSLPVQTPRLRLKAKGGLPGFVDGAWWPHSRDLTVELPDLLAVLSVRLGRLERVLYNMNEWLEPPRKIDFGGFRVSLGGFRGQLFDTVQIIGMERDRLTLVVIPPDTEPDDAHTAMMRAALPDNVESVAALLDPVPAAG